VVIIHTIRIKQKLCLAEYVSFIFRCIRLV